MTSRAVLSRRRHLLGLCSQQPFPSLCRCLSLFSSTSGSSGFGFQWSSGSLWGFCQTQTRSFPRATHSCDSFCCPCQGDWQSLQAAASSASSKGRADNQHKLPSREFGQMKFVYKISRTLRILVLWQKREKNRKIRMIAALLSIVTYLKLNFNLTVKYTQIQLEDKKQQN